MRCNLSADKKEENLVDVHKNFGGGGKQEYCEKQSTNAHPPRVLVFRVSYGATKLGKGRKILS